MASDGLNPSHNLSEVSEVSTSYAFAERIETLFSSKLHLPNLEVEPVIIPESLLHRATAQFRYSLVGWVCDNVEVSIHELRTMFSGSELPRPVNVEAIHIVDEAKDMFVVKLTNPRDMHLLLFSQPWIYQGHLVVLKPWNPDVPPHQVRFTHAFMWVQLLKLPWMFNDYDILAPVFSSTGTWLNIECPAGSLSSVFPPAARMLIPLSEAIISTVRVNLGSSGEHVFVEFAYENRPVIMCPNCLRIGHRGILNCPFKPRQEFLNAAFSIKATDRLLPAAATFPQRSSLVREVCDVYDEVFLRVKMEGAVPTDELSDDDQQQSNVLFSSPRRKMELIHSFIRLAIMYELQLPAGNPMQPIQIPTFQHHDGHNPTSPPPGSHDPGVQSKSTKSSSTSSSPETVSPGHLAAAMEMQSMGKGDGAEPKIDGSIPAVEHSQQEKPRPLIATVGPSSTPTSSFKKRTFLGGIEEQRCIGAAPSAMVLEHGKKKQKTLSPNSEALVVGLIQPPQQP